MNKSTVIKLGLFALMNTLVLCALLFAMLRLGLNPWGYIIIAYAALSTGGMCLWFARMKKHREEEEKKPKEREPWEKT